MTSSRPRSRRKPRADADPGVGLVLKDVWATRITRTGSSNPADLVANPANWRQHPRHQRQALREMLETVGWVQGVVVNEQTGHMVDGHLRAELAVEDKAKAVPTIWVDLTEDEERLVLAALDPLGDLAVGNPQALADLLESVNVDTDALAGLLKDLSESLVDAGNLDDGGEPPGEDDFWPYIRVQVSRDTLKQWEQWFPGQPGDSDDARIRSVMGELPPGD